MHAAKDIIGAISDAERETFQLDLARAERDEALGDIADMGESLKMLDDVVLNMLVSSAKLATAQGDLATGFALIQVIRQRLPFSTERFTARSSG